MGDRGSRGGPARAGTARRTLIGLAAAAMLVSLLPAAALAQPGTGEPTTDDPRFGLDAGFLDAEQSSVGMELLGSFEKPDGELFDPDNIGSFAVASSDLAFTGDHAIQGNFGGFQIHDISDPTNPTLRTEVICPGGQGDPNVWGDLLFVSVEQANGRIDCGTQGTEGAVDPDRFRGVRIFDISDLDNPEQVGGVQTCRGSHTHRVVEDLNDPSRVFIYVSGTSFIRPDEELEGCHDGGIQTEPEFDESTSLYQVEVIEVPLDRPEDAQIVNEARIFADEETGALNALQNEPLQPQHPSGANWGPQPNTNTCHDITVYPELGLAAGACQGNGLLLDITDPADPQRIDEVADVNFSYWHSANFNNDGSAVLFTDEWGGGTGARCRATDRLEWGANALYDIVEGEDGLELEFASYYKLPVVQTSTENCVAHQANIVPVPGRDLIVQAWYQGGISIFDWTDTSDPHEIAHFDRGPISDQSIVLGGFWSAYWYNGNVYGAEIARGLDAFELTPTDDLTANEIAAANTVSFDELNPMGQFEITWEPSFEVVRAYADQAERAGLSDQLVRRVGDFVDRAERFQSGPQRRAAVAQLNAVAGQVGPEFEDLSEALRDLADDLG